MSIGKLMAIQRGELPPLIEVAASYFNEDYAPTDVTG